VGELKAMIRGVNDTQICAKLRSLVWNVKSTTGKLLCEALLLSKVVFSWRVIICRGTRDCFIRTLQRKTELSDRKVRNSLMNRKTGCCCSAFLGDSRNWNTD
jgi:hypothetical protein